MFYVKNNIIKKILYFQIDILHQDKKQQEEIINFIENLEYNILELPKPDKVLFLDIHETNYEYLKNSYFRLLDIAKSPNWTKNKTKIIKRIHNEIIENIK